ncbi:MAG: hypothetical protein R3C25_13425 [Hyphomonadaceae bacterium]
MKDVRMVFSQAFEGDDAPPQLAASIVSLVELCHLAMPDIDRMRQAILGAGFIAGADLRANEAGESLGLDNKVMATPITNLKHELFGRGRDGAAVILLLSQGDSPSGKVVFCSIITRGAIEADLVKAVNHVSKKTPLTGATVRNSLGLPLRRVFWDIGGGDGIRGMMVTGPENMDSDLAMRAITAFNFATPRN